MIPAEQGGAKVSTKAAAKTIRLDYLKIDRRFVAGLPNENEPDIALLQLTVEEYRESIELIPIQLEISPEEVDLVGYTCMEDDYIAVGQLLPRLEVGDLLRIRGVGAYTTVLKPPFIRGAPPIYLLTGDRVVTARREETADDLLACYEL